MIVTACCILTRLLSTFIRVRLLAVSLMAPTAKKQIPSHPSSSYSPFWSSRVLEDLPPWPPSRRHSYYLCVFFFDISIFENLYLFWDICVFFAASGWRETRALVSSSTTEKESPLPWHLAKSTIHLNFSFGYIARRHQHRSAPSLRLCW